MLCEERAAQPVLPGEIHGLTRERAEVSRLLLVVSLQASDFVKTEKPPKRKRAELKKREREREVKERKV